jgi:hypothetical protein
LSGAWTFGKNTSAGGAMEEIFVRYTTQLPKLASQQFDDEIVVANFETGIYYSLIGTAADIWLGLKAGLAAEALAAAFSNCEAPDAAESVKNFVEELRAENIIAPCDNDSPPEAWSPQFSNPFSKPVLDRFDDLRDLIFLDPVHDVSDAGWPIRVTDGD